MKPVTIQWQKVERESALGRMLGLDESRQVPFYVLPAFADAESAPDGALDVLRGVLIGFLHPVAPEDAAFIRRSMEGAADFMSGQGRPTSAEKLVLDLAASLGAEHGLMASVEALQFGMLAFPGSTRIRSDYITILWLTMRHVEPSSRKELLESIVTAFDGVDLCELNAAVREALVFITYAALSLLGRHTERESFYASRVAMHVTGSRLAPAVAYLRGNTSFDEGFVFSRPVFEVEEAGSAPN